MKVYVAPEKIFGMDVRLSWAAGCYLLKQLRLDYFDNVGSPTVTNGQAIIACNSTGTSSLTGTATDTANIWFK